MGDLAAYLHEQIDQDKEYKVPWHTDDSKKDRLLSDVFIHACMVTGMATSDPEFYIAIGQLKEAVELYKKELRSK